MSEYLLGERTSFHSQSETYILYPIRYFAERTLALWQNNIPMKREEGRLRRPSSLFGDVLVVTILSL